MGFSDETYAAARKYTNDTVAGAGGLAGVPCQIQSITSITGGKRVTFLWEDNTGATHTSTMDVMNGAKGDKGDRGDRGETGPQGVQGIQGAQGVQGIKGDTGAQGIQGPQGIQGIQGEKGDDGYPFLIYKQYDDISEFDPSEFTEIGLMFMVMQEDYDPEDPTTSIGYPIYRYTGSGTPPYSLVCHLASQGIKGDKGDKGDTGAQGPQGIQGPKGDEGPQGPQGVQGEQGIQGEQGVGIYAMQVSEISGEAHLMVKFTDDTATWVDCGAIASDVPIATEEVAGIVKPDGTTITVDENGVISGANTLEGGAGITISDNKVNADTNIFKGTVAQYEALSTEAKKKYSHIGSPDELTEDVADAVTDGDKRPVTSDAVYDEFGRRLTVVRGSVTTGGYGGTTLPTMYSNGYQVSFGVTFKKPPIVCAYVNSSAPGANGAVATSITTTGCNIGAWRFGSAMTSNTIDWVAMGEVN